MSVVQELGFVKIRHTTVHLSASQNGGRSLLVWGAGTAADMGVFTTSSVGGNPCLDSISSSV